MSTPNADQKAAADAFLDFMLSDAKYAAITGPAGTGKTYLMNFLSNHGLKMYEDACTLMDEKPVDYQVDFAATTNKAAEVLSNSLGKNVGTIHSYLGLKIRPNFTTGKTDLIKGNNYQTRYNRVMFIDEASTIDNVLLEFIDDAFVDSKIIFVGDHAQMAPVNEDVSPCFYIVEPENYYNLTTPVRNAETPALMALCQQLRETVETGIFKPMERVDGIIEYLSPEVMQQGLSIIFADADPSCRVLNYTNERVRDYNTHIRADVRQLPDHLTVGEAVVVGQAYAYGKLQFSVEQQLTISYVSAESEIEFPYIDGPIKARRVGFGEQGEPDGDGPFFGAYVCTQPAALKFYLDELKRKKDWRNFYDLKDRFLDIRDKAACTVYKSQGSTYDFVFIDIGNIGTSFDAQQVARMLYVAVSRAKYRVYFYGELPGRYQNSQGVPLWNPESGPNVLQQNSSSTIEAA